MLSSTIGRLRIVGFIEGISYLVLLGIAMPIKYVEALGKNPNPVKYVGAAHGFLFVAYCILILLAALEYKWSVKKAIVLFIGSILPFGTFYTDKKFLQNGEAEKAW